MCEHRGNTCKYTSVLCVSLCVLLWERRFADRVEYQWVQHNDPSTILFAEPGEACVVEPKWSLEKEEQNRISNVNPSLFPRAIIPLSVNRSSIDALPLPHLVARILFNCTVLRVPQRFGSDEITETPSAFRPLHIYCTGRDVSRGAETRRNAESSLGVPQMGDQPGWTATRVTTISKDVAFQHRLGIR